MGELPGLAAKVRLTEAGKQVPIGNGGVGPNYWWNQTLSEASVYFDVAPGTPSKSVRWTVTPTTVRLALLGHSEPLLEGELGGKVAPGDSLWEIEDGKTLVITFEKAIQTWWRSVVVGHPEIDATLVDSTRRVEDYDDETQATIRKIMHEQRTKRP